MADRAAVGTPERGEAVEEVPGVLRWADLQNEESNGDGYDRIAQCDDPCGITLGPVRLTARLPSRGNPSAWILAAAAGLL
jgi:hypothetical protein